MTSGKEKSGSHPADPSRFEVVRVLGSGGMACVYEVFDRRLQRRLALKRLQASADEQRQRRVLELFEHEFYTLTQLSHPAIVQVFDYGVDEQGAYYTMELLEGQDLQVLAPMPYKLACAIALEIASALSVLHSRRLVYRDLNPRNVHCSVHGTPKLIDFGAVAAMGTCANVVGTPAYCAPEAIDLEPLDARTDLFSLGATLYYAITGHHAYPAKTFAHVRQLWGAALARPSAYVPDLPASLDALIMDSLKLDPAERPAHAGELMEQLAVITGRTIDERAGVMQAYLSTPNMVGRESALAQVRTKLKHASRSRGSAVLITSASGGGRSRFLAACQLAAKLSGALVAHASSSGASSDYGVIRALGNSLVDVEPELARRAAQGQRELLEQIVPKLADAEPAIAAPSKLARPDVLAAVQHWITAVARERIVFLGIDDLHRSDEPSAACLSWLARSCGEHRILLVASSEAEASSIAPAAVKLFESNASLVTLDNLSELQTVELVRSVFGDVPNVQVLGRKLYAVAAGNPRDTLRLAQNLVDRGAAKYRSGAWSLPASDGSWLPESMHQAVVGELDALDPVARGLARVLSLAEDRALDFEECMLACGAAPAQSVHEALQQLLRIQIAKLEGERYTIAHRGLHAAVRSGTEVAALQLGHNQLAEIFKRRGDEPFREAKHLLLSGDAARGVDALVEFSVTTQTRTDNDPTEYVQLVVSMPDDWLDVFDVAVAQCEQLGRSPSDTFRLRNRLSSLLNIMGASSHVHLLALIRQLCQDSGLDAYAKLDPTLDGAERLKRALAETRQRYESSPEQERGLEPGLAIRYLVRSTMLAAGMVALGLDYALWQALPSIAPLAPLSPAFALVEQLVGAVAARVAGRHEYARSVYTQILARLDQPDLGGLDPSNHRFLRFGVMYGVALIEAGMGLPASEGWAQILETEPLHAVNALQVRMVRDLWLGRAREADEIREAAELRRIASSTRQMPDGSHLMWQMLAHAYCDDLMRLKQVIDDLRTLAERHAAWTPVVDYALGEYHRLRGDHAQAFEHLNAALARLTAGTHQLWPHAAASHISALCAKKDFDSAVQIGERYLQVAERAELGFLMNYLRMPLALANVQLGRHARALELSQSALESFSALGTCGLNLVLVYETCSRVALHAGNLADHQHFAKQCAQVCRDVSARSLRARSERLLQGFETGAISRGALTPEQLVTSQIETSLRSAFREGDDPGQRAMRALQWLLEQSGMQHGALYVIREHSPMLAAHIGPPPSAELHASVLELLTAELGQGELETVSLRPEAGATSLPTVLGAHQLVLLSHQTADGVAVSGVAALAGAPNHQLNHPGAVAAVLSRMLAQHRG